MLTSNRRFHYETDGVPIEECAGDLMSVARLSKSGAVAKASLNRALVAGIRPETQ